MGTQKPPRQWESKQMFQCLGLKQGVLSTINTPLRNLWISSREPRAPVNVYLKFCLFAHLYVCLRRRSTAFIRLSSRSVTTTTKVKIPRAGKDKITHQLSLSRTLFVILPLQRWSPSRPPSPHLPRAPTEVDPESQGAVFSSSKGSGNLPHVYKRLSNHFYFIFVQAIFCYGTPDFFFF